MIDYTFNSKSECKTIQILTENQIADTFVVTFEERENIHCFYVTNNAHSCKIKKIVEI